MVITQQVDSCDVDQRNVTVITKPIYDLEFNQGM